MFVHCVHIVGLADCGAMALMGHNSVESTAPPRKRNLPQTFWMNFLSFLLSGVAVDSCVAYCCLAPYLMGAH
jgi:hypothetical protein